VAKHLIRRGAQVPVPFDVVSYAESGLEFVGRPRVATKYCVAHWTGAENAPSAMYFNMLNRTINGKRAPLSIHLCVDQLGAIYQMADLETRCVHAGDANAFSVGIEFIGRGNATHLPAKGIRRERVTETIQGVRVKYDELLPAQITSGVALLEALCDLYELPLRVPENVDHSVRAKALSADELGVFRGVIGHLHVQEGKTDPGLGLLRAVQRRGRARETLPVA
jgi:hypothetical protein